MNLSGLILKLAGWKVDITVPRTDKCVICVAPHTSNWDFVLGYLAYRSIGRRANFLMKQAWFFFPLKYLFTAMGGIAVPKKRGSKLTDQIIEMFRHRDYVNLAVTPEGTRSRTDNWRTGFLHIANKCHVPVMLGVIDYGRKRIIIEEEFHPSHNIDADMQTIADYYSRFPEAALYPDKFTLPKH